MTHRKKSVITHGSDQIKRYAASADLATSPSETNSCPTADSNLGSSTPQSCSSVNGIPQEREQRRARRFPVCSPATMRWLGSDGVVHETAGVIRDISTCGLFVEADAPLRTNNNVELEITPFGMQPETPKTELHFEGRIVRKERDGFAVAGFLWLAKLGVRIT